MRVISLQVNSSDGSPEMIEKAIFLIEFFINFHTNEANYSNQSFSRPYKS